MSAGLLLPDVSSDEYRTAVEEFPAYGWVLLRLAGFPLDLRTVLKLLLIASHETAMGTVISAVLCMLPCRTDCLIRAYKARSGIQSLRIPDAVVRPFLLIARPHRIFTATFFGRISLVASTGASTGCPSI